MDLVLIFAAKYLYLIIILIFIGFFFTLERKLKLKMIVLSLFALPLTLIASRLASMIYNNPRPFEIKDITPKIEHAAGNGFPSDHTLLCVSLSLIIWHFNKKLGALMFILTLCVGLSRVWAEVHHLVDIIGAIAISLVVSYAVIFIVEKIQLTEKVQKLLFLIRPTSPSSPSSA